MKKNKLGLMEISELDINKLCQTIKNVSNYDFGDYTLKSFTRRIEKILSDYKCDINYLCQNIEKDYNFMIKVVEDITVNTTELFRDSDVWEDICTLLRQKNALKETIKIWHAGCSIGLEVYSFLVLIKELGLLDKTMIYATDLNESVLEVAQQGKYRIYDAEDYMNNFNKAVNNNNILNRKINFEDYFEINKSKNYIKVVDELLEKPIFLKHDLTTLDNIFNTTFDIISCRNVLIYFNQDLQTKVLNFFADNLNPQGNLIIGKHEGIVGSPLLRFTKRNNIYYKK